MHDGISMEKRGVPAAVICTDPFIPTARAMSRLQGLPDYPFAVVPHPIGSLTREQVRERAIKALPQVLEMLLSK